MMRELRRSFFGRGEALIQLARADAFTFRPNIDAKLSDPPPRIKSTAYNQGPVHVASC